MSILIGIALLIGLLVFFIVDRRHLAQARDRPLSREIMEQGWRPSSITRWLPFAGIALIMAVMGVMELMQPKTPPFTGRWAFVFSAVYGLAPHAIALFWLVLAAAFALAAFLAWRATKDGKR
jgi:hypothetical protein